MSKLFIFLSVNLLWSLSSECFISPKVLIMNSEDLFPSAREFDVSDDEALSEEQEEEDYSEELEDEGLANNFDDLGQPPLETYWVEDPLWGAGLEVQESSSPVEIEGYDDPYSLMILRRKIRSRLTLR